MIAESGLARELPAPGWSGDACSGVLSWGSPSSGIGLRRWHV